MNQKVKIDNIFSTSNGIFMYGERVVIPAVLTEKILKDFYTGHLGMKVLIRTYVSSSLSCRAASTDIPDPLSPRLPIIHRFWIKA